MQAAAQVTELEVPLHSRVAWLRHNYSYFEDEHKDVLMRKLDALTKTSGKKVCHCRMKAFVKACRTHLYMCTQYAKLHRLVDIYGSFVLTVL